jgi:hypothetical protein
MSPAFPQRSRSQRVSGRRVVDEVVNLAVEGGALVSDLLYAFKCFGKSLDRHVATLEATRMLSEESHPKRAI